MNNDNSARRAKLESCVAEANAAFDRNLASNGDEGAQRIVQRVRTCLGRDAETEASQD